MTTYVEWNEPFWGSKDSGDILGNTIVRALPDDVIKYWRYTHPQREWTDEQALDQFIVINWAWIKEYDE